MRADAREVLLQALPQQPPMRFIDEIVEVNAQSIRCLSAIREDHLFLRESDGRAPSLLVLELFAQAAAALMIHRAHLRATGAALPNARGMLVGARTLDFAVDGFEVGDVLSLRLEERYSSGDVAQLAGTVERNGLVVASGAINVARGHPSSRAHSA